MIGTLHRESLSTVVSRRSVRWIVLLLGIALLVYGFRFIEAPQLGISNDDARYVVLAESFATGRPYRVISYPHEPFETIWPPGYPLIFLTPAWLLFGPQYDVFRLISLVLSLLSIPLIYLYASKFLDWRAGFLYFVVALFALNPRVAGYAGMTRAEAPFIFLTLCHMVSVQWLSQRYKEQKSSWLPLTISGITLAAGILVRYQGAALAAASFFYLVLRKRTKHAIFLATITGAVLLPFILFVFSNVDSPNSLFAVSATTGRLDQIWHNLPDTIENYWRAVPLVMVPLLGPSASAFFGRLGLGALVDIVHALILLPFFWGLFSSLRRREQHALYLVFYFMLVFVITNPDYGEIHDEPRYVTAVLPFIYLIFLTGIVELAKVVEVRFHHAIQSTKNVVLGLVLLILVILLGRNVQQANSEFTVVDLSIGATWIAENTSRDAIIMTHDPVSRYVHIHRKTVDFSYDTLPDDYPQILNESNINYLLIAPPLVLDSGANTKQELHPFITQRILPFIKNSPEQFKLVYAEPAHQTWIYEFVP